MENLVVPDGYNRMMAYVIVAGGEQFMDFMKNIFGATEKMIVMRSENVIMHGELMIGDTVLMFADATPEIIERTAGFFIYVADADATYSKALASGCQAVSPMADQPYGRSGGFADPFGNTWWVTTAL